MSQATVRLQVGPLHTSILPALAEGLLDHPDLIALLVRNHHLAPYRIETRGAGRYFVDDGAGTSGDVSLVEKSPGRRTYFLEGIHTSRVFPPIHATAVISVALKPAAKDGCGTILESTFDVSIRLRSRTLHALVKSLAPFMRATVAGKFSTAHRVAREIGRLVSQDPAAVRREVDGFPGLSAAERSSLRALITAPPLLPPGCSGTSGKSVE